jgi:hypothetical protein
MSAAAGGSPIVGIDVVRLITGDQVKLVRYADGTHHATILPGSPHAHRQIATANTPNGLLVIPRLPLGEQRRIDPSTFNVTALARLHSSRVPVTVTFAAGVAPHLVSGLSLDLTSAHRSTSGATTVDGAYSTSYPGLAPASLAGVQSIALPAAQPTPTPSSLPTHELTIHLGAVGAGPADFAFGFIENVDDASRYLETPIIENGVLKVDVPAGNYAVMAYSFSRLVEAPEFAVTDDMTLRLDLDDATVKPRVTVPRYGLVDSTYSISRYPAGGFSFALIFSGPSFFMRVQPSSGQVAEGTFTSGVTGTFALRGDHGGEVPSSLAVTADLRPGVPASLTFAHHRSDFARVVQHFRSNGPAGLRMTNVSALAHNADLQSLQYYPVQVPGTRPILLQASSRVVYAQEFDPTQTPDSMTSLVGLVKFSRYPKPGTVPGVSFAYGPVGPGPEARYDTRSVGRYCRLCRFGDSLNGAFTLFTGAGTAMSAFLGRDDAGWSLRRQGKVLAAGHGYLNLHARVPSSRQPYVLIATSHPASPLWQLSTNVKDVWTFASASGRASIPILMPSYLPHTTVCGAMASGHTTFRLDFGNLGPVDSTVTKAFVTFSIDGGVTWQHATLTRLDHNSFRVSYDNPARSGTHRFMSLRVSGTDAAGRRVTETAMRAYHLLP